MMQDKRAKIGTHCVPLHLLPKISLIFRCYVLLIFEVICVKIPVNIKKGIFHSIKIEDSRNSMIENGLKLSALISYFNLEVVLARDEAF